MNKTKHVIFGIVIAVFFIGLTHYFLNWFDLLNYKTYLLLIPIIPIYSLLPDVDLKNSTITWFFLCLGIVGIVISIFFKDFLLEFSFSLYKYLLYFSIGLLVAIIVANKFTKHRGVIHTEWAALMFSLPLYFVFNEIAWVCLAFICFQSHLWGDGYVLKFK